GALPALQAPGRCDAGVRERGRGNCTAGDQCEGGGVQGDSERKRANSGEPGKGREEQLQLLAMGPKLSSDTDQHFKA
ncbi:unnamed protein product, partial [Symbiodinium microadriaticum]